VQAAKVENALPFPFGLERPRDVGAALQRFEDFRDFREKLAGAQSAFEK
jgi:hypothetical protein